jgi:hypothetical protein
MATTRVGTVEHVEERESDQLVTVRFLDGAEATVSAPGMIFIETGSSVAQLDAGDGKPVYSWG